jgi:hypothetical protein
MGMSLLNRSPISIGRAHRPTRDARFFVVSSEDTYAPKQYLEQLSLPRVRFMVLPTPKDKGQSSPTHVVDRLKEAHADVKQRGQIQDGDEFWVLIDTDHRFDGSHLQGTIEALRTARQAGFEVAVSNPCFELWLLLHHVEISVGHRFSRGDDLEKALRDALGSFVKTSIKPGQFPLSRVPDAIQRAKALETDPNDPADPWPKATGSRVYRLMERVLGHSI